MSDKTNKTTQYNTRQANLRQYKSIQDNTKQGKTRQYKTP